MLFQQSLKIEEFLDNAGVLNYEERRPEPIQQEENNLFSSFYELRLPALRKSLNESISINLSGSWGLR